jgi:hypothetical protein
MDWVQIILALVGVILILMGLFSRRKNWFAFLMGVAIIIAVFTAWPFLKHLFSNIMGTVTGGSTWSVYAVIHYTDGTKQTIPNVNPQLFVTMDKTKCINDIEWHITKPAFSPGAVTAKLWLYWDGYKIFGKDFLGKTIWEKTVTVNFKNGTDSVAYVMPYSELRDAVQNNVIVLQIPFVNQWDEMSMNMGADITAGDQTVKLNYEHVFNIYVSTNDNIIKCTGGGEQGPGIKIVSVEVEYGTQAIMPQAIDPNNVESGATLSTAFVGMIASIISAVAAMITAVKR